jgi:hypothetical protein
MIKATTYSATISLKVLLAATAAALGILIAVQTVHAAPIGEPAVSVVSPHIQAVQFYGGPGYRPYGPRPHYRPYYGGRPYGGGYGRGHSRGGYGHGGGHGGGGRGGGRHGEGGNR